MSVHLTYGSIVLKHQNGSSWLSVQRVVILGRPFVKQFTLCYHSVVCLSCLSVMLVYCGQTVGRIKIKLGTHVGLGPGHIVLDGDPAPPPQRGTALQFSAPICCGQTAACIKMSLGMELGLGPGDFVLHGDPAPPPKKGAEPPNFRPMVIVVKRLDGSRWYLAWR